MSMLWTVITDSGDQREPDEVVLETTVEAEAIEAVKALVALGKSATVRARSLTKRIPTSRSNAWPDR